MSNLQDALEAGIAQRRYSNAAGLNKLVGVNDEMGNRGLGSAQATTRVIYDTLPVTTANPQFRFFEGCSSRTFPRTNLSEAKLQVDESLVVKYINFHAVVFSAAGALPVVSVETLATTFASLYRGDYSVEIGNSTVLKPTPLDTQLPAFNKFARHTAHETGRMLTNLIIPSLIEFVVVLRNTSTTTSTTKEIMCMIEGEATILSPKSRF